MFMFIIFRIESVPNKTRVNLSVQKKKKKEHL